MLNCRRSIACTAYLKKYIEAVPGLVLDGCFIDPLEAVPFLESGKIDVVFLDIHLPKISGIDLLKSLHHTPHIILTTAFSEYALEGFELDVVDYLLKPFSFERFLKSISKINRLAMNKSPIFHQKYLFVKNKGEINKVLVDDVLFMEAKGDFIILNTNEKRHIVNTSLQEILNKLDQRFVRCHKSYVINISFIDKIIGNRIKVKDQSISIGRAYKNGLLEQLKMV